MTEPLIIRVRNALASINDPITNQNIVASGMVQGLRADDAGRVHFVLEINVDPRGEPGSAEGLLQKAKEAAQVVDGVVSVSALLTAHNSGAGPGTASTAPKTPPAPAGGHDNPLGLKKSAVQDAADEALGDVTNVIAIASGKGGVGKSTFAANLAVSLAASGLRVGLLDADISGPSVPTLFGLTGKATMRDGKIAPAQKFGVTVMSIGMLVDPDQALAWRGPMVMGALRQLLREVDWGTLDVLLVDTPPGTGDAHLSLIQTKRLDGAVIVSTPQEMALADVRRGVALFRKTDIEIIGIVENMAWLESAGGERQYLFGQGGARRAAEVLDAPFLGETPILQELREASDAGTPLATDERVRAQYFKPITDKITAWLATR